MPQERHAKRRRTRIRRSRRRFTRTTILRRACRSRRRPVRPRTMPVEKQPARRDRRQEPPGKLETSLKKIRIVNRRGENGFRQRDKIAKAQRELDILGRELEKAQVEYYPDPQKAMQQQNTRADINAINGKIDAKKQELDQLKKGLDDLEDQLRKSGGDPGWAR